MCRPMRGTAPGACYCRATRWRSARTTNHSCSGARITTVFRPGNRVFPNRRGYIAGESVTARVIERCGCDRLGVPPLFNEVRIPIRITHLAVFFIDCVNDADFGGSSPDVFDRRSLIDHLERIYEEPIDSFNRTVTRIGFRYLD